MTMAAFDVQRCALQGTQLVEASAGTGKTWTLCALYLRLLLEQGLEVQRILVVTFTNAATAELRERIRARIVETLAQLRGAAAGTGDDFVATLLQRLRERGGVSDESLALRLDLALQSFDEAAIFTIHGFCQRALADMPFGTGMPMTQTLLTDDREFRQRAVQDFWRRRIAGGALPPALADHLLERKDSPQRLQPLLARVLAKPLATRLWPENIDVPPPLPDDAALQAAYTAARASWSNERERIVAIVREALPRLPLPRYGEAALSECVQSWDACFARDDPLASLAGLEKLDLLSARRLQPKRGQAPPAPHPFFALAAQLLVLQAARDDVLALQRLALLHELLDAAPRALRRSKREQRVIAFDDMLFNLHQRLSGSDGPALARLLRQRFAAALIDEFQDTDALQYAIFRALYGDSGAALFLVGDPKQAIYSFRGADLQVYLQARGEADAEHTLVHNQRSSPGLLEAQNALFSANARAFMLPGLDYHAVDFGSKRRQRFDDRSAVARTALQLWRLPRGDDGDALTKPQAAAAALDACAGEIARLIAAGRDGSIRLDDRALRAGDIAVLVRSHAQGAAARRALARAGVGSVELSQASVFDSAEAAELQLLLAAVFDPTRAALLRAALATVMSGLDAAALQQLTHDDDALLVRAGRFAALRELWLQRGVGPMLRQWMRTEGVGRRLLAHADGERRLTNLLHLCELLQQAAVGHAAPEALQQWLQAQRDDETRADDAAQLRLESDRDLVQVVTIHKSKGLEYPLVFCPLLWDGHGGSAPRGEGLEYHDAQGHAVIDFRPLDKEQRAHATAMARQEREAESLRLIYVALTRAMQRCYLVVGSYRRKHANSWSTSESGRARLHWLVAGAGLTPENWNAHRLGPERIEAAWAALAQGHPGAIALDALPAGSIVPLPPLPLAAESVAARTPPPLPRGWWIGSYSSLTHGARHEAAAVDHDARARTEAAAEPPAALDPGDILRFPRGAVAGECLHAVFESADFGDTAQWPAAVKGALRRFAQALPGREHAAVWPDMLLRLLHDVLHTPLSDGLRLADVPVAKRQAEFEFHLPAPQLDARALGDWLHGQGLAPPATAFGSLRGYLRGFIDLVFEHGGRYFVLDWKSNHLGYTPADYAPPALERTMREQAYPLQALLYALALHRHLQRRLPHYSHDAHFGGVLYLFVRGVRPHWRLGDGGATGVHAQRPSLQVLDQLSALLDGAGPST